MRQKKKALKIVGIVLLVFFVLFSIISLVFIKINFDDLFGRTEKGDYTAYLRYEDVKEEYDRELLSFQSGENKLQGYLYGMDNTKGLVVISHGLGGRAESYFSETLYFVENGYQVFAYDNTGCYLSEGKNSVGLSQSVIDLDAALTYIEGEPRFEGLPVLLYGHSWGGYAVTAIFNYEHDITAAVSVAGFNKPMEMILEWTKDMMGTGLAYVEQPYIYLYQKFLFGKNANMSALDGINRVSTPILLIHGSEDTTVGFDGAGTIAYRDKITNPNVQYMVCDGEKQNDHNQLYQSLAAITYLDELDEAYAKVYDQYDGEVPDEVRAEFFAGIDKHRTSELDEQFMTNVLSFYEESCARRNDRK